MQVAEVEMNEIASSGYAEAFPPEVEFVISALEAGPQPIVDRQRHPRLRHRVKAYLRLFSDAAAAGRRLLYTRQVSTRALGFLTEQALPLSHGGVISLAGPDGEVIDVNCAVLRCRMAAPGWYEGAVYFNRPQRAFEIGPG